jgi:hypothetical protein
LLVSIVKVNDGEDPPNDADAVRTFPDAATPSRSAVSQAVAKYPCELVEQLIVTADGAQAKEILAAVSANILVVLTEATPVT